MSKSDTQDSDAEHCPECFSTLGTEETCMTCEFARITEVEA